MINSSEYIIKFRNIIDKFLKSRLMIREILWFKILIFGRINFIEVIYVDIWIWKRWQNGGYEYFDFYNYSIFLEILQDNFMIILNKFKWFDENVDFMWCLSRVE